MKVIKVSRNQQNEAINEAVNLLSSGGMVIYPTETCYGIGVDATNEKAVAKLISYKGGREGKAISVAVDDKRMASKYVSINESANHLYTQFLPGPVTIVSKSLGKVAKALESDIHTLGIRIPDHSLALQLIQAFGKPITSTSANTSGKKSPYSLNELKKYTSETKLTLVDLFLDAGQLPYRPPSTVVDTTLNDIKVLRQGEISLNKQLAEEKVTDTEGKTQALAQAIVLRYLNSIKNKPLILALQGELGAGKTQFAKGVAKALGIKVNVPSPTYTIVREYEYSTPEVKPARPAGGAAPTSGVKKFMFHIDTWRLHEGEELMTLGLNDMLKPGNVIVIEWLQKAKVVIEQFESQAKIIWVEMDQTSETNRTIRWWSKD